MGEMDVARVNPYPPGQSELVHWFGISAHGLVCIPPVKDGHQPGDDSTVCLLPGDDLVWMKKVESVDGVHQAGSHRALRDQG